MSKPYETKTKRRGDDVIMRAYERIKENGPVTARGLCELTGCVMPTVGSHRVMRFNEYMRDRNLPHLFTASRGGKNNGPVTWNIRERK